MIKVKLTAALLTTTKTETTTTTIKCDEVVVETVNTKIKNISIRKRIRVCMPTLVEFSFSVRFV